MTNAQAIRKGLTPCEWNPFAMRPSRLTDGFHAKAELMAGKASKERAVQDRQLRVCRDCSARPEVGEYVRTPGRAVAWREVPESEKPLTSDWDDAIQQIEEEP